MALTPAKTHSRAKVAALTRAIRAGERPPDDPALVDAYRDLACARLAEYAANLVAEWPPLTNEQIDTVAAILRNGGGHDA